MKYSAFVFAMMISLLPQAWGHGEEKPGPHGGHIRMPGAMHTELVQSSKASFELYLLDIQWKNPMTANSSVTATHKRKKKETAIDCKPEGFRFVCSLPKELQLKAGDLITVNPARNGVKGIPAEYRFPLKFPKVSSPHDHSGN